MIKCKNCNENAEGNYCSNCGQSTRTGRINLHTIVHEFFHGIVHVDKGILYTIRELTFRPGDTIRGYFEGKRVNLFKPFGYFFIIATLYVFLTHMSGNAVVSIDISTTNTEMDSELKTIQENIVRAVKMINSMVEKHYSLMMLCSIPVTALLSMLFFRKEKLNYGEHLIMNSYILGHQILLNILFIPLYYFYEWQTVHTWFFWMQLGLYIYMISCIFNNMKLWKRIVYSLLVQISLMIVMFVTTVTFIVAFLIYKDIQ